MFGKDKFDIEELKEKAINKEEMTKDEIKFFIKTTKKSPSQFMMDHKYDTGELVKGPDKVVYTAPEPKLSKDSIVCPYCKSKDVEFMQNKRKGFSAGKAVVGAIATAGTGGIGGLVGFAGKKGKNEFFCKNCNRTFVQN